MGLLLRVRVGLLLLLLLLRLGLLLHARCERLEPVPRLAREILKSGLALLEGGVLLLLLGEGRLE